MARRTEPAAAHRFLLVLISIPLACCSRREPVDQAYRHAWSVYASGNLPQAVLECSRNSALWPDPGSPWFWSFRLLKAEVLNAQGKPEEAEALLKDPVPAQPALRQLETRRLVDRATVRIDRPGEAIAILAQARIGAQDPELTMRIRMVEGLVARYQGKYEAARAALKEAAEMAGRQRMPYWQALALNNQALATKNLNLYEEAVETGLHALEVAEKAGARRVAALAHANLGSAYSYLGEYDIALDHAEKAAKTLEAIEDRANYMIALGELGLMYDRQDVTDRAVASYERAFALACELKKERDAERTAGNLALTLIKAEQWDRAEEWNQKALDLAPRVKDDDIPYLIRNRARIAYERGQVEEAIRLCQKLLQSEKKDLSLRWSVYELMGASDAKAGRFSKANREFASALRIIDENRSALADSHFRMTLLSRLIPFYDAYVDSLVQQENHAAAIRIAESSRARVLTELLKRDEEPEQFPDAASLRRVARETHSVLLSFWLAPVRSFAWLITAETIRPFQLPPAGKIGKLVTAYRDVVEHPLSDPILAKQSAGADLWNALMAEIGPAIPKGSQVIVIPDGALDRLNLETLVVPLPEPHYWIDDVEIRVAPSITIAASQPVSQAGQSRSLLLIGDPDYTGPDFLPLKNAGKEVKDIASRFSGAPLTVFTGPKALPAAYKDSSPGRFSHIHFAAHAEANSQNPLESAVILSGTSTQNRLHARDVIDIPIHADLVTISACQSAGVRSYAGEGLIGFAWAFLRAGAHTVVAGLWDVSDSSTEPLMDRFYAGIAAGQNPASALHNAKLALRKEDVRFAKPFYWGPFQAYIASAVK